MKPSVLRSFAQKASFYELLGVSPSSGPKELKEAYLIQAKKFHPDSPEGNEEKFKQIAAAYQVLKNAELKSDYDKKLKKHESKKPSNDTHSSASEHKTHSQAFSSSSWSGGRFNSAKPENSHKSSLKPTDVLVKMITYSLTAGSLVYLAVLLHALLQPVPEREKITRPEVLTKKPSRLQSKPH